MQDFHVQQHPYFSLSCSPAMSMTVFPRLCFDDTFSNAEGNFSKGNVHSTCGRICNKVNKNAKFFIDIIKSFHHHGSHILYTMLYILCHKMAPFYYCHNSSLLSNNVHNFWQMYSITNLHKVKMIYN